MICQPGVSSVWYLSGQRRPWASRYSCCGRHRGLSMETWGPPLHGVQWPFCHESGQEQEGHPEHAGPVTPGSHLGEGPRPKEWSHSQPKPSLHAGVQLPRAEGTHRLGPLSLTRASSAGRGGLTRKPHGAQHHCRGGRRAGRRSSPEGPRGSGWTLPSLPCPPPSCLGPPARPGGSQRPARVPLTGPPGRHASLRREQFARPRETLDGQELHCCVDLLRGDGGLHLGDPTAGA